MTADDVGSDRRRGRGPSELIAFLETGDGRRRACSRPTCSSTSPCRTWRLQAQGVGTTPSPLRRAGHPAPGRVPRSRFDPTPTGFVLEVEETWEDAGDSWYCRELFRADVGPDGHHRPVGLLHRRLGRAPGSPSTPGRSR